eukprot:TRINITY_DN7783_c0_g1_i1.p1 TRINITY_DN7783_c0_g1~~TRINITY_DN7783_c0_g1_i1.p1  ORF type:complete len:615 (+),score=155.10 TRINITY_DN7783_c0_g1_i1:36-1880(+)
MANDAAGGLALISTIESSYATCVACAQDGKLPEANAWLEIGSTALASLAKLKVEVPSSTMRRRAAATIMIAMFGDRLGLMDVIPLFDELVMHEALQSEEETQPKGGRKKKGQKKKKTQSMPKFPFAIDELRYRLRVQAWREHIEFHGRNNSLGDYDEELVEEHFKPFDNVKGLADQLYNKNKYTTSDFMVKLLEKVYMKKDGAVPGTYNDFMEHDLHTWAGFETRMLAYLDGILASLGEPPLIAAARVATAAENTATTNSEPPAEDQSADVVQSSQPTTELNPHNLQLGWSDVKRLAQEENVAKSLSRLTGLPIRMARSATSSLRTTPVVSKPRQPSSQRRTPASARAGRQFAPARRRRVEEMEHTPGLSPAIVLPEEDMEGKSQMDQELFRQARAETTPHSPRRRQGRKQRRNRRVVVDDEEDDEDELASARPRPRAKRAKNAPLEEDDDDDYEDDEDDEDEWLSRGGSTRALAGRLKANSRRLNKSNRALPDPIDEFRRPQRELSDDEVTEPRSRPRATNSRSRSVSSTPRARATPGSATSQMRQVIRRSDGRGERRRWTEDEVADLIAGVEKHGEGRWMEILSDDKYNFGDRTNVDLKDKYRNLRRSGRVE